MIDAFQSIKSVYQKPIFCQALPPYFIWFLSTFFRFFYTSFSLIFDQFYTQIPHLFLGNKICKSRKPR